MAWGKSHHARAMQPATPGAILGDFNSAEVRLGAERARFLREGNRYLVDIQGEDGTHHRLEILHAIGFEPLQQYLVGLPDGRLQVLPYAWDARRRGDGGQRWYSINGDQPLAPSDPLHWTGPYQNWNWMCADCHTTNLDRNYEPRSNSFTTTWKEFNVGCESCHGPGSRHVAWAALPDPSDRGLGLVVQLDERNGQSWVTDADTGLPRRQPRRETQRELHVCAQCHSRRTPLDEGMDHDGRFADTHEIGLLDGGRYFPDGQQREEVYEVGSFMQSRMHAAGVSCSDCHEPHSGELRAPGDAVCGQCHAPQRFAARAHTLHQSGSRGSACVDCHMPARVYMGVDVRRDHALQVPRPEASARVGAPDACTSCHQDRDVAWAQAAIRSAHGPGDAERERPGDALHAAATGQPQAASELAALAADSRLPAITRATMLSQLRRYLSPDNAGVVTDALSASDPMVRAAAVDALLAAPAPFRAAATVPLASDSSRIVRIRVAEGLAEQDPATVPEPARAALDAATLEFIQSRLANADRAEARVELASFFARQGKVAQAQSEYRAAIALQPGFTPSYLGLVDLLAVTGRDSEIDAVLDNAERAIPGNPAWLHARGLLRVRQGRLEAALPLLQQASAMAPRNMDYAYVLAVAQYDAGHPSAAIRTLERSLERAPGDARLTAALRDYTASSGGQEGRR